MDPERLLLEFLEVIDRVTASCCRRHRLEGADADDFASTVRLRLIENDYAVLRSFQGRSSFRTYICVVVERMLLDYRIHLWGKWHPSAEARRLGETAVRLEQLLYRDGRSLDEAIVMIDDAPDALRQMATRLPVREPRRRSVSIDEACSLPTLDRPPDEPAYDAERAAAAGRISALVRQFIDRLAGDDRLLLRLRFHAGMTVAQIARSLHLDQKSLYRKLEKLFRQMRLELERAGVGRANVDDLIGSQGELLDFRLRNESARPSMDDGGELEARPKEIPR